MHESGIGNEQVARRPRDASLRSPAQRRRVPPIDVSVILAIALWLAAAAAAAQSSGGTYRIEPAVVANGRGTVGAGALQMRGTLGQAQTATLSGAGYRVYGGFWSPQSDVIFANGFN